MLFNALSVSSDNNREDHHRKLNQSSNRTTTSQGRGVNASQSSSSRSNATRTNRVQNSGFKLAPNSNNMTKYAVMAPKRNADFYHLKGRGKMAYLELRPIDKLSLFQVALELFNRKSVRMMLMKPPPTCEATEICRYFFECVGKTKVTPKFCTECRDVGKSRKWYDNYYMDLVEVAQERSIRCYDCMYKLLKKHIFGNEDGLRQELRFLRVQQSEGLLVDAYMICCGY